MPDAAVSTPPLSYYEAVYLLQYQVELMLQIFSVFLAVTTTAIVGAYVAGRRLTRAMSAGILVVYTLVAYLLTRGRWTLGERGRDLIDDVKRFVVPQVPDSTWLQNTIEGSSSFGLVTHGAIGGYILIYLVTVFFVVYARHRISAQES